MGVAAFAVTPGVDGQFLVQILADPQYELSGVLFARGFGG